MATKKEFFKNATFKQKIHYFWEYYKVHAFIVILLVVSVPSFIYHRVTDPELILSGIFLNAYDLENETTAKDLGQEFLESEKIDTKKYDVNFNDSLFLSGNDTTDYEHEQAVWVQCGAGTIDFMISPIEHLMDAAHQQYYADLTTVLTETQIKKYEPYFLYIDGAVVEKKAAAPADAPLDDIEIPDPAKPEAMEDPIPVFINMAQCEELITIYDDAETLAFSLLINAPDSDLALRFLDYLME